MGGQRTPLPFELKPRTNEEAAIKKVWSGGRAFQAEGIAKYKGSRLE